MGRRRKARAESKSDPFATLMAALAIILLAFFILLNSLTVKDARRRKAALGSLVGSFGILSGGMGLEDGPFLRRGKPVVDGSDLLAGVKDELELLLISTEWAEPGADVRWEEVDGEFRVTFSDRVVFRPRSVDLHPRLFPVLDEIGHVAGELARAIRVEGHTGNAPARVLSDLLRDNWDLSLARASVVADYLAAATPVNATHIVATGMAEHRPLPPPAAVAATTINRRVVIALRSQDIGRPDDPAGWTP